MTRAAVLALLLVAAAGCGQKGPLIAPEPAPAEQRPAADGTDDADDADAEAKRRRGR